MGLRQDERQWLIYDPNTVELVFKALEASALVMYGEWLQMRAKGSGSLIGESMARIGTVLSKMGDARQQIQAGLAPNDVPDELVEAQRGLDLLNRWLQNPNSVSASKVAEVVDQIAAAMTYMDERTKDTGTNHPRWNSRLVSGQPCKSCGR